MTLISKLKRLIFGQPRRDEQSTRVPVEREPAAESERAVKESAPAESSEESVAEPETETESEVEPEPAPQADSEPGGDGDAPVQSISGIGPAYAERLEEAGVGTVGELAAADAAELAEATGIGEGRVSDWIERAKGD